jgi:hypothetical protein
MSIHLERGRHILWAGMLVAVLLSSCSPGTRDQEAPDCTPWIVEASDEVLEVTLLNGHWHFEGNALLVGCRETLDTLTPDERKKAAGAIIGFVAQESLGILKRAEPEFRLEVVAAVNKAMGRPIVSDAWLQFSFSETDL